jgi:hypothetical protein
MAGISNESSAPRDSKKLQVRGGQFQTFSNIFAKRPYNLGMLALRILPLAMAPTVVTPA